LSAELLDTSRRSLEIAETGEDALVRLRVRFHADVEEPVIGFLLRNRHGIHLYGTNTKEQQLNFGAVRRGETIEVTFAFTLWLGIDDYSLSCAVHSRDGISYDWLDGVLFFRITSMVLVEGVANLNATATARRLDEQISARRDEEKLSVS
jgi:hypothetical protein